MKPMNPKSRLRRGSASVYKYLKRERFIREPCKCDKQILETAETKIIWIFSGKGAPLGKTWWSILLLGGIVVTVYNVVMCSTKYYAYPTITKETFESSMVSDNRIHQFPKITICLNSMHSRSALIREYNTHVHNVTTFLYGFYGDNHGEDFSKFWYDITNANENYLDTIDLEHFMRVTRPSLQILVHERAMQRSLERCPGIRTSSETVYGICKQMEPTADLFKDPNKQTAAFGRQSSMSIVAEYNSSDWGSGWAHFIDGCTVYISPRHEETLDPDDSVILNPGSVPIVSIRQRKQKKMHYPFRKRSHIHRFDSDESNCVQRDSNVLKYFKEYTKKHCIYECLIDLVIKSCNCLEFGFY